MSGPAGEPAATWDSQSSRCGECATDFDGLACPTCGEHADADPLRMLGFVFERDDGKYLVVTEAGDDGWTHSEGRISQEQASWLTR